MGTDADTVSIPEVLSPFTRLSGLRSKIDFRDLGAGPWGKKPLMISGMTKQYYTLCFGAEEPTLIVLSRMRKSEMWSKLQSSQGLPEPSTFKFFNCDVVGESQCGEDIVWFLNENRICDPRCNAVWRIG